MNTNPERPVSSQSRPLRQGSAATSVASGGHQQQYEQMLIKENHQLREQYEVRDGLVMQEL